MTDLDDDPAGSGAPQPQGGASEDEAAVDGRVARRERNVAAVVDVVLQMFEEDAMFPTIEQVAIRSGLSLRSMYRYFADPGELLEAAIARSAEIGRGATHLHAIGQGPLEKRISDFVAMRLRSCATIGPRYRATVANAAQRPRIAAELSLMRDDLRAQFELQFAPEIDGMKPKQRQAVVASGDLLTQMDAILFLQRQREFSDSEIEAVLVSGLAALLS